MSTGLPHLLSRLKRWSFVRHCKGQIEQLSSLHDNLVENIEQDQHELESVRLELQRLRSQLRAATQFAAPPVLQRHSAATGPAQPE
jgi:conjugal transfer/entry exclusion protein